MLHRTKSLSLCLCLFSLLNLCVNLINADKCGYKSCDIGLRNAVNVHLIPHSHDDVGWLKTIDEYYYGNKDSIQPAGVQYILDTVIKALLENPNRKFSYVEIAFFNRWWKEQSDPMKKQVKQLVNEGRFQFLLGGWSMNDEAASHYTAIIDQLTIGLDFLNQTFGKCGRPLASWQIDPFGHSIEQASIFSKIGYDSLFIGRLDYRDHAQRIKESRMEFLQATSSLPSNNNDTLFTSILYNMYSPPNGFCFDGQCTDEPIMDDPDLYNYNVKERVRDFIKYLDPLTSTFTTNHILVPMGSDFQFQNAFHNFKNLDKLIYYTNKIQSKYHLLYSTPACYAYAVNKANKTYTKKNDDFFPYASDPHTYWTGYFSSRPSTKGYMRLANSIFQATKKIYATSGLSNTNLNKNLHEMAMIIGEMQHHDAITGTERQLVTFDYMKRLTDAVNKGENVMSYSLRKLMNIKDPNIDFVFCNIRNISYCKETDNMVYNKPLYLVLYNPLEYPVLEWLRIPVGVTDNDYFHVTNSTGSPIRSELVPISSRTMNIPERMTFHPNANYELVFKTFVPSLGFSTYTIVRNSSKTYYSAVRLKLNSSVNIFSTITVSNDVINLTYINGILEKITNKKSSLSLAVHQIISYYDTTVNGVRNSGAYIFRPSSSLKNAYFPISMSIIKGSLVTEVHQQFRSWMTLVTRLYKGNDMIETEWTVGPIPYTNNKVSDTGKEVVLHYEVLDMNNKGHFYTDANGRQVLERVIDKRNDYMFNQTEEIAGNYYPITTGAMLRKYDKVSNQTASFAVFSDRAQGVGAYNVKSDKESVAQHGGMLEFLLHRRCQADDGFGVSEALNETGIDGRGLVVRGRQWFIVDSDDKLMTEKRDREIKLFNKPTVLFMKSEFTPFFRLKTDRNNLTHSSILITQRLPKGIHLLSLENHYKLDDYQVDYQIMRLENIYVGEQKPIEVDMTAIVNDIGVIKYYEELNLSANQLLKNVHRLRWNLQSQNRDNSSHNNPNGYNSNNNNNNNKYNKIKVHSGEIRTFKIL